MTLRTVTICSAIALTMTGCATQIREKIYRADPTPVTIANYVRTMPQTLSIVADDKQSLTGYYWQGDPEDKDVIIFFHGRGSNQGIGARYAEHLSGHGDHVIVASYRGFGGNMGTPTEEGLIKDGMAFVATARQLIGPQAHIYLVGHSLGGAVALHVATHQSVSGVITIGAFDKLGEEVPLGLGGSLPDKWNNLSAVRQINTPYIMIQGSADHRVDAKQAEALFREAPSPATKITINGAGHNPDMNVIAPIIIEVIKAIDQNAVKSFPKIPIPDMRIEHK